MYSLNKTKQLTEGSVVLACGCKELERGSLDRMRTKDKPSVPEPLQSGSHQAKSSLWSAGTPAPARGWGDRRICLPGQSLLGV